MSAEPCLCESCFYCDKALSSRHEHDHFPVPKARGGLNIVSTCINCHDLKDRIALTNWPISLVGGIAEIISAIPEDLKAGIDLESPSGLIRAVGDYTQRWQAWTVAGRLFYAKVLSLSTWYPNGHG